MHELLAHSASIALFSLGEKTAFSFLEKLDMSELYVDILHSFPIWNGSQSSDEPFYDGFTSYPFDFLYETEGVRWNFKRTQRKLLIVEVHVGDFVSPIAIEISPITKNVVAPKGIYLLGSGFNLIENIIQRFSNVHLRMLTIQDCGRMGILLPKRLGWGVFPILSVSFGAAGLVGQSEMEFGMVSLADFISQKSSGALLGSN